MYQCPPVIQAPVIRGEGKSSRSWNAVIKCFQVFSTILDEKKINQQNEIGDKIKQGACL